MKDALGGAASPGIEFGAARLTSFSTRLLLLAALLLAELIVFSLWLDGDSLTASTGFVAGMREWGAFSLRSVVGFAAVLGILLYTRGLALFAGVVAAAEASRWRPSLLLGHLILVAGFALQSARIYSGQAGDSVAGLIWLALGLGSSALAAFASFPWAVWRAATKAAGSLVAVSVIVAVAASAGASWSRELWQPATKVTFWLVQHMLSPLLAIRTEPERLILRAPNFGVKVAPECSGLEGAGLMLIFGVVWLWLFRREFRFPRALALVPLGIVAVFLLNAVRIAALLVLGSAGAKSIAVGGFHSQAGWIAFNLTAFGFAILARRWAWFGVATAMDRDEPQAAAQPDVNPVAPFLVPFLAILAAGIVATAAAARFEWLYPLRFIACAAALWTFRARYQELNWRVSWVGPAAGAGVFLLWIGVDRLLHGAGTSTMPDVLANAGVPLRVMWIVIRALAAATTVPIAEELAFRGFLMRRLMSADFEQVDPRMAGWLAMGVSSVVFGMMHGGLWHVGIAAGLVYAMVYRRTRSLGDAAAAHAVTNALIAVYVLQWSYWRLW